MTSLYDTLGVEPDATPDQIKQAYRRAAMRWHPDRNEANRKDAEARFKTVAMAYAVLSDSIKRRQYDAEVNADRAAEAEAAKAAEADVVDSVETFVDALFSMARVTWNDLSQSDARAMFTEILIRRGCPPEMTVKLMASLLDESGNFNLTPPQTPPLRRSSPQPQYPRASAVVRPLPRGFRRSVALGFLLAAAAFGVLLASMLGKL